MFRISGIIAFQTKKSNLERNIRKETDLQRKIRNFLTWFFRSFLCQSDANKKEVNI